jgi:hypothetical protein
VAFNQSISAPYAGASTGYPVHVEFPILESHNKFYAIPIVGYVVKYIMLIPYSIAMLVLALVVYVCQLVVWFPVMTTGQYPEWAFRLNSGLIRYVKRSSSFFSGLTDRYPSFSLEDQPGDGDAMVVFEPQQTYSKFWAIPIVGISVKYIILIPHLIILNVLGLVVALLQLVTWIPVLFGGKYPLWGYQLVGGTIRWSARVMAYGLGLTDQYPPFSLAE